MFEFIFLCLNHVNRLTSPFPILTRAGKCDSDVNAMSDVILPCQGEMGCIRVCYHEVGLACSSCPAAAHYGSGYSPKPLG